MAGRVSSVFANRLNADVAGLMDHDRSQKVRRGGTFIGNAEDRQTEKVRRGTGNVVQAKHRPVFLQKLDFVVGVNQFDRNGEKE